MLAVAAACGYHWADLPHRYTRSTSAGLTLYVHLRRVCTEIKEASLQPGDLILLWIRRRDHPAHLVIHAGDNVIHASPMGSRVVSERRITDFRGKVFAAFRFRRSAAVSPCHEVDLNALVVCEKCVLADPGKYARPGKSGCRCGK